MGTIFKKRNKWFIDYYDPNGKRIRKSVSRYKETAHLALKKVEIEIAEGKYLDVQRSDPISFKDFADKFFRKHIQRRNKSIKNQEYLLNGLVKYFGKKMIAEITANDIDEYLEKRQEYCLASTVNSDLTMLKSMYNRANDWGDLQGHNPPKDLKKLPENNERCRYLLPDEQKRLLSYCNGVLHLAVHTALRTGLRKGELFSLKWKQSPQSNYVDLKNDVILVHEALSKSKKSRYIPLAKSVKQALLDYPQHSESGYIFANPKTGKPIIDLKKSFKTALRSAGIKDFVWHDLRHCFASDLVRNGADLFVVQKLLGHSSPKMTQRYAHLRADHLQEAICNFDEDKDEIFSFRHHMDTTPCTTFVNT